MKKNLITNPIRLSQPAGAALAFLGINRSIPLWHGVQGCTAFAKILFISHFREPMPFQTTALNQSSVIMGGDDNILTALKQVENQTSFVGILSTGVAETNGTDIPRVVREYKAKGGKAHVVSVNTSDYEGSLETGYLKACEAVLDQFVGEKVGSCSQKICVFMGPYFTPGEVEELRRLFEIFELDPTFFPDLGNSLFGYITPDLHSPCTWGGTSIADIEGLADSSYVISIGSSMKKLALKFAQKNELEALHFDHLATLEEMDSFLLKLELISAKKIPQSLHQARAHFQDSVLDVSSYFHDKTAVICGDPELITRWQAPLESMGVEVVPACGLATKQFSETDLNDVKIWCDSGNIDLLVGNTHVAKVAEKCSLATVRCGIPVEDRIGEPQKVRIGYRGAADLLRECVNGFLASRKKNPVYISPLQQTLL